jgi:hypothetical protein
VHDVGICILLSTVVLLPSLRSSATNVGVTYTGALSPPYPKRAVCEPTSPIKDPVSSPQYMVEWNAVMGLGRTGRRREITVSGMKIRDGMAVDLHGCGEEAV